MSDGKVMAVNGSEGHKPVPRPADIAVNQTSTAPAMVTTGFNPKNLGPYASK